MLSITLLAYSSLICATSIISNYNLPQHYSSFCTEKINRYPLLSMGSLVCHVRSSFLVVKYCGGLGKY